MGVGGAHPHTLCPLLTPWFPGIVTLRVWMYVCLGAGGTEEGFPASYLGVWGLRAQRGGLTAPLCFASLSPCPGFDMTPNYVDSSPTGIVVSPWCSCRGSGNMEEECEKFLRDFTENPCLRKSCSPRSPPSSPSHPHPKGALRLPEPCPSSSIGTASDLWGCSSKVSPVETVAGLSESH